MRPELLLILKLLSLPSMIAGSQLENHCSVTYEKLFESPAIVDITSPSGLPPDPWRPDFSGRELLVLYSYVFSHLLNYHH